MTDRELLQQALDALNTCDWDYDYDEESYKTFDEDLVNAAAAALEEALAKPERWGDSAISDPVFLKSQRDINGAIRQLVQIEQEPLAWATFDGEGNFDFRSYEGNETYRDDYIKRTGKKYENWVLPLYVAPPRKEWVSLTDDEVYEIANFCKDQPFNFYAKEIENKLRIKNAV
jgi:hypothetical protein